MMAKRIFDWLYRNWEGLVFIVMALIGLALAAFMFGRTLVE